MEQKKNILLIEDSALMRRIISDIINSDDNLQVNDIAENGIEAIDLLTHGRRYDAIVLDVHMPKMNGIECLKKMKEIKQKLKVIIVSSLEEKNANETIEALELGAFDFIKKPAKFLGEDNGKFAAKIISRLYLAAGLKPEEPKDIKTNLKTSIVGEKAVKNEQVTYKNVKKTKLISLACSTGGPKALQEVIPKLPKNLDAPLVIVQHMPEGFTNSLAQRLDEISPIKVKEAEDGDILKKGVVYLAKGGSQLRIGHVKQGVHQIIITNEEPVNGLRPCADLMYQSLVESDYEEIICVVMTGMGADGTKGIKELSSKKSTFVIAQDEKTCTVYGMPKSIFEAGLTDEVTPLNSIADAMIKRTGV